MFTLNDQYLLRDNQTVDLRDYFEILKKRRKAFAFSAGVVLILTLALTFMMSPIYMSKATILIEEQDIPTDLLRSTVTSPASQRIQTISQRVMTRDILLQIAEKYNIFIEARKEERTQDILDSMRKRISIDVVDLKVDKAGGRRGMVAIAFTVSFRHANPEITQRVTSEIVDLFLKRNESYRSAKANETLVFLTTEANTQSKQITVLEAKIATFKEQYQDSLPEMREINLRQVNDLERQQADTETQIRSLQERKFNLVGDLAKISPWSPMISSTGERVADPSSMLRVLRMQLVNARTKYSAKHPTIVSLKHEIASMEKQVGSKGLASVAGIEPDNPAYITLRARLNAVESELKSLQTLSTQLEEKLLTYGRRLELAPQVERDFLSLSRDYDSALRRYQKIKDSQTEARVRRDLEKTSAEEFTLIDPPQIPQNPIRPNRPLIGMIGFLLSLIAGVIGAALSHSQSQQAVSTGIALVEDPEPEYCPVVFSRQTKDNHINLIGGRRS